MLDDLTGKVALVTGGNRGIGRAIAIALSEAGADVAVNYRTHREEADDVCREIEQGSPGRGRRCVAVQADVARAEDVTRLVSSIATGLGPIAILVNNAGVSKPVALDRLDAALWADTIATNLTSAFLVTQAVLPWMRETRWGRIINVSSVAAQLGGVVGPHYAASKAGMHGMTHAYAALLAKEGITANAIAPALIETAMIANNPKAKPDLIPVGRFGAADEVAAVAVMLARNGYITGQTINVNGGWYMS
jgi:3-oxoacyl-[acyl-carrier protein] reductase